MFKLKRAVTTALASMLVPTMAYAGTVTVPVSLDTSVTNTVTGYIAEIEYDPTVLEPVVSGANNLSEDNYAAPSENLADRGIFTASVLGNKVTVGWADRVQYDLENGGNLANVTFNVLDNSAVTTAVKTTFFQVAKYPDVMDGNTYEYSQDIELQKYIESEPVTVTVKNMGEDGDCLPKVDIVEEISTEATTEEATEAATEVSTETTTVAVTEAGNTDEAASDNAPADTTAVENAETNVVEETAAADETAVSENTAENSQLEQLAAVELDE